MYNTHCFVVDNESNKGVVSDLPTRAWKRRYGCCCANQALLNEWLILADLPLKQRDPRAMIERIVTVIIEEVIKGLHNL